MKGYIILLLLSVLIFSGVTNVSGSNMEDGKKIFDEKCQFCHGEKPGVPPISILSELSENTITDKVRSGVQGTVMRSFSTDELSANDLNSVITYLKSLSTANVANKSPGFDTNIGILSILFIYFIYNKINRTNSRKQRM